jgi:hypothetical protein
MNEIKNIEKYLNTKNEHFNNNAYFWYSYLEDSTLFSDIELPFKILLEYLHFLDNYRNPISCVERLNHIMKEENLTKKQKIFIYDKLNGLIANDDYHNRDNLANINSRILKFRLGLEPYEDLDLECYSIDAITKEALMFDDLNQRLRFLKHRKFKYEQEASEIGYDIGLGQEIQIEIEIIEKQLYPVNKIIQNHSGKGDNIGRDKTEIHHHYTNAETPTGKGLFDNNPKRQPIDKTELKDLVIDGDTDEVFEVLLEKSQDVVLSREIELLKTNWRGIKRQLRKTTISDNDFEVKNAKIVESLLEWIGEW